MNRRTIFALCDGRPSQRSARRFFLKRRLMSRRIVHSLSFRIPRLDSHASEPARLVRALNVIMTAAVTRFQPTLERMTGVRTLIPHVLTVCGRSAKPDSSKKPKVTPFRNPLFNQKPCLLFPCPDCFFVTFDSPFQRFLTREAQTPEQMPDASVLIQDASP